MTEEQKEAERRAGIEMQHNMALALLGDAGLKTDYKKEGSILDIIGDI